MDKLLAVFNQDLKTIAFVDLNLEAEFIGGQSDEQLSSALKKISGHAVISARSEVDGHEVFALSQISKDNPRYLKALAESVRRAGFVTAVIPTALKEVFRNLDKLDSYDKRQEIISSVSNLSDDDAADLIRDMESLK